MAYTPNTGGTSIEELLAKLQPASTVPNSLEDLMAMLGQSGPQAPSASPANLGTPQVSMGGFGPGMRFQSPSVSYRKESNEAPDNTLSTLLGVGGKLPGSANPLDPTSFHPHIPQGIMGPKIQESGAAEPTNPMADVMAQIQALMMGGGNEGDNETIEEAIANASRSAGAGFGAQIGSVRRQNKQAKADTKEGSGAIRRMYNKLSNSYKRQATGEEEAAGRLSEKMSAAGQQSAEGMQQNLQDNLTANAAAGETLGSEALTQSLNSQVEKTSTENTGRLMDQSQRDATTALKRGDANRDYFSRGASGVRLEGTNRRADLFGDLQDYLQGNRDKISELQGQRAAASSSAGASAASQLASAQAESQQQQIQNLMNFAELSNSMTQQGFENNLAQQELGAGAGAGLMDQIPDQFQDSYMLNQLASPQVKNIMKYMSDNTSMGTGMYDTPGGPAPLDNMRNMQDYLQDRITRDPALGEGAWNNLPPDQRNILLMMALSQVAKPQQQTNRF